MIRLSLCGVARRGERYLLGLRKPGGSQGGLWEFPGGKAEEGESPEEALKREFEEELGIIIRVETRPVFVGTFTNGEKKYRLEAYEISFNEETLNSVEHDKLAWVDLNEMDSLALCPSDKLVQEHLKKIR